MSTELATPNADTKLSQWVMREEVQQQIRAAIGDVMNADTFISHAIVSFQDAKVVHCSPKSKLKALYEMAALTLLPTLAQCALVPRNVKIKGPDGRESYELQITLVPQWQGYKAVLERHPSVLEVDARLVHIRDTFEMVDGDPRHVYDPFDASRVFRGPKDIRGGYCKITYTDGRPPRYHFCSVDYIEKCRRCAETDKIWSMWYEKMARKTIYRDTYSSRIVPVDPLVISRMEKIVKLDDAILGNSPVPVVSLPSGNERLKQAITGDTTNPHKAAGDAAAAEAAAGPNGTEADLGEKAKADYLAALAGTSGIRTVQTIYEARLPLLPEGSAEWAAEARDARLAEIRASRGEGSSKPKPDAGKERTEGEMVAHFRARIKKAGNDPIETKRVARAIGASGLPEEVAAELMGAIGA